MCKWARELIENTQRYKRACKPLDYQIEPGDGRHDFDWREYERQIDAWAEKCYQRAKAKHEKKSQQ